MKEFQYVFLLIQMGVVLSEVQLQGGPGMLLPALSLRSISGMHLPGCREELSEGICSSVFVLLLISVFHVRCHKVLWSC